MNKYNSKGVLDPSMWIHLQVFKLQITLFIFLMSLKNQSWRFNSSKYGWLQGDKKKKGRNNKNITREIEKENEIEMANY